MSKEDRIRNLMMLDYSQLIMYASSLEELNDINHKEIERLNNIINELEKWLDKEKNQLKFEDDYDSAFILEIVEEKLQELKGNNNGVWVNNLLEVIKENNIEFGSDKE